MGIFMFEGRVIIFWLVWIFMGCTQKWFFHWHHLWNIVFFLRYIPLRLLTLILSVWDKRVSWVESHVEPSFLFRTWSWICPLIVGKLADFAQLKLVVWRKIPRLRPPPPSANRSVWKFDLLFLDSVFASGNLPTAPVTTPLQQQILAPNPITAEDPRLSRFKWSQVWSPWRSPCACSPQQWRSCGEKTSPARRAR